MNRNAYEMYIIIPKNGFHKIVIYTMREEGKAFVHANCMFVHDAQRSGGCNSSEQKQPYSRVLYLILFDT
jgi:hypothetical protein